MSAILQDLGALVHTGEFYATFCALLWAVAVILFRKGGETVAPVALNIFKTTIGLLAFSLSMWVLGKPFFPEGVSGMDWGVLLLSGALGAGVADTLFFASLNRLGAGRVAIVDCLYSPAVMVCSAIYLHEPTGPVLYLSLVAMTGALLLGGYAPEEGDPDRAVLLRGLWLGCLSMVLMAVAVVAAKPILDRVEPWWATLVRLVGAQVFLLVLGASRRHRRHVLAAFRPGPAWRYMVPGALVGTYMAMFFWMLGMKYTQTNIASVLNQSTTLFLMLFAFVFLRERVTRRKLGALALGFGGVCMLVFS